MRFFLGWRSLSSLEMLSSQLNQQRSRALCRNNHARSPRDINFSPTPNASFVNLVTWQQKMMSTVRIPIVSSFLKSYERTTAKVQSNIYPDSVCLFLILCALLMKRPDLSLKRKLLLKLIILSSLLFDCVWLLIKSFSNCWQKNLTSSIIGHHLLLNLHCNDHFQAVICLSNEVFSRVHCTQLIIRL